MKTLQKIQEENRKFIIMANNPSAKTYEEALEMELGFGCELLVNDNILCYVNGDPIYNDEKPTFNKYILEEVKEISTGSFTKKDKIKLIGCDNLRDFKDIKIIGKPLTLDRVLIAFGRESLGLWKDLKKETLEDQSEETQREINNI